NERFIHEPPDDPDFLYVRLFINIENGKLDLSSAGPEDGSLSGSTPHFSLSLKDANPAANDL
ncbi:hypothetical protein EVA_22269, partial [gut metagenome]